MFNSRQEFTTVVVDNWIYLISGYNSSGHKEERYLKYCEKMDLLSLNTHKTCNVSCPRTWAGSLNFQNKALYLFGGYNPNYQTNYIDKIEKYLI